MADVWQHYKGGIYNVISLAIHTETEERLVVYEDTRGQVWVRPVDMFLENVENDGVEAPRFKKVGDFYK